MELDEATWNEILNLTDPGHYRCGTPVALPACPAEARSDLGCGGRKTGRAKHKPLEAFDERSSRSEKAKSRVSACFQGTAFLHRRHGNLGNRVGQFGHFAHNRDSTAPSRSLFENKIHSKWLRKQHGHCYGHGNGRRNKRWEDPRLQAERCVHFQRRTVWGLNRWREALHAASQARTLEGNPERAAVWTCVPEPGLCAL